jgi:hypothetical protein
MSSPWYIGQKVICTNDSFPRSIFEWCDSLPVAGEVYTIRAIRFGIDPTTLIGDTGFLLVEIVNSPNSKGYEPGFFQDRFVLWMDAAVNSDAVEELQPQAAT